MSKTYKLFVYTPDTLEWLLLQIRYSAENEAIAYTSASYGWLYPIPGYNQPT